MIIDDVLLLRKAKRIKDYDPIQLGTQTITETKKEETDRDNNQFLDKTAIFGTQTLTNLSKESTDSDRDKFIFGTETFTKTREENSDSDIHNDIGNYKYK